MLIPEAAPLAPDVNFEELGSRFELSGGHIKSAVFRAAVRAEVEWRELHSLHARGLSAHFPIAHARWKRLCSPTPRSA